MWKIASFFAKLWTNSETVYLDEHIYLQYPLVSPLFNFGKKLSTRSTASIGEVPPYYLYPFPSSLPTYYIYLLLSVPSSCLIFLSVSFPCFSFSCLGAGGRCQIITETTSCAPSINRLRCRYPRVLIRRHLLLCRQPRLRHLRNHSRKACY